MTARDATPPPDRRNDLMEVYKNISDTWRSQVDSSWQRSSYFAAFEIAALGGCWLLVSDEKRLLSVATGIAFSVGALLLTRIWYRSTKKMHAYVRHWWESLIKIEDALRLETFAFARQLESQGKDEYRHLLTQIPTLFGIAWVLLLLIGVIRFAATALHCASFTH